MANTFWKSPSANYTQTTLNGAITSGAGSITLNSTTNMQSPGYVVVDRTDSNGAATANAREVISYTGISGQQLTGCVRGADGSTARSHSDAAIVETMPVVGMWSDLVTIVSAGLDTQGLLLAQASAVSLAIVRHIQTDVTSIASIARIEGGALALASSASLVELHVGTFIDVSAASIQGLGLAPVFIGSGAYSGPTIAIGGLLIAPRATTLRWVSIVTKYVASGTSVGFDFKIRGASAFANATMQPAISSGGTFVSTASLATKNINVGDILQGDVSSLLSGAGMIQEVTIQAGS